MDNNNFYNDQQSNNGFDNNMNNGYNNMNNGYNNMNNGYNNMNNGYNNVNNGYNVYNKPASDNSGTSKICGILSIVLCFIGWFCCIGYAGVPLAIVAIVFAIQSKNNNGGEFNSDAKIGLITGIIGLGVLVLGFGVGVVIGIVSAAAGM